MRAVRKPGRWLWEGRLVGTGFHEAPETGWGRFTAGQTAASFLTLSFEMFLLLFIAPYLSVFSSFPLQYWFSHSMRLPLEGPWLML